MATPRLLGGVAATAATALVWSARSSRDLSVTPREEQVFRRFNDAPDAFSPVPWLPMQAGSIAAGLRDRGGDDTHSRSRGCPERGGGRHGRVGRGQADQAARRPQPTGRASRRRSRPRAETARIGVSVRPCGGFADTRPRDGSIRRSRGGRRDDRRGHRREPNVRRCPPPAGHRRRLRDRHSRGLHGPSAGT